jgi:hypothetical protein
VVVPEQVAQAVNRQEEQLVLQGSLAPAGGGLHRDHDVAEELGRWRESLSLREREDVGRSVHAAESAVERVDRAIVAE